MLCQSQGRSTADSSSATAHASQAQRAGSGPKYSCSPEVDCWRTAFMHLHGAGPVRRSGCCAGRFADKAALVRKAAVQLAGALLAYNPFGAFLGLGQLEASLAQHQALLQVRSRQPVASPDSAASGNQAPVPCCSDLSRAAGGFCGTAPDAAGGARLAVPGSTLTHGRGCATGQHVAAGLHACLPLLLMLTCTPSLVL